MRRSALLLLAVVLGAFACESFGAAEDEGETPAEDGGAGRTKTEDAAIADAGVDVERGPFDDIEYDAFDGFERGEDVTGGPLQWTAVSVPEGHEDEAVTAGACAGPPCRSKTTALFNNGVAYIGYLETELREDTRSMRLDFAMTLVPDASVVGASQVQMASFELEGDRYIFFERAGDRLRLGDQFRDAPDAEYDSAFTDVGDASVLNEWGHYRLFLDLDGGVVAIAKEGAPLGPTRVLRPEVVGHKVEKARIGITYAINGLFTLAFDDVGLKQWP